MSDKMFYGKTIEEATEKAEVELGLKKDSLQIEVVEEKSKGIFGLKWGKSVCINVTEKAGTTTGTTDIFRDILSKLIELSGFSADIEVKEVFDEIILDVNISSDNESIFIGRRGKNLDAYQYMVNKIAARKISERGKRIFVDCADYRARSRERLEKMARRAASKVRKDKKSYSFPPMQANERRIIHMTMKEEGLSTESRGHGNEKKVLVLPPCST